MSNTLDAEWCCHEQDLDGDVGMSWYVGVLKKYAVFAGRARRKEFWMFALVSLVISFMLGTIEGVLGFASDTEQSVLSIVYGLIVLVPELAVGVRRLHDTGRNGWYMLWLFIPIANWFLLYWLAQKGTAGPNEYGSDPKEPTIDTTRSAVAAGWMTDPSGRHQLRYWDGAMWTQSVADNGTQAIDPLSA
jgi:uncharacterized membrane protein YhaH (DUF805 family)